MQAPDDMPAARPASAPDVAAGPKPRRIVAIDIARGIALLAMASYHATWDLGALGLIDPDIVTSPGLRMYARLIAGSFLVLVGVSLILAHGRGIRWRPFLVRLGQVAVAALAVTLVTWRMFPDSYIFFGILHAIAVFSLLALPFLRAPPWLILLASLFVFAGPALLAGPAFDAPWLAWLGLGLRVPLTNDFEPVFPWFGCVLLGMAAARLALPRPPGAAPREAGSPRDAAPARGLGWLALAGRHSLAFYLIHQPVLFGILWCVAQVVGPSATIAARPFLKSCQAQCQEAGQGEKLCAATCGCTMQALQREGLWAGTLANNLGREDRDRVAGLARQCFTAGRPAE